MLLICKELPNAGPQLNHGIKETKGDAGLQLRTGSRAEGCGSHASMPWGGSARSVTAEVGDEADGPHLEGTQQQPLQKAGYNGTFSLPAVPLALDPPPFTLP